MNKKNTTKKKEIVSNAIILFKEKGYNNVSVNEICRVCGIVKSTFYYYFNSKDELLDHFYYLSPTIEDNIFKSLTIEKNIEKLWFFMNIYINYEILNGSEILSQVIKSNLDSDKGGLFYMVPNSVPRHICVDLINAAKEANEIKNSSDAEDIYDSLYYSTMGISLMWSVKKGNFDKTKESRKIFDTILEIA